jgi:hypothetical protein
MESLPFRRLYVIDESPALRRPQAGAAEAVRTPKPASEHD